MLCDGVQCAWITGSPGGFQAGGLVWGQWVADDSRCDAGERHDVVEVELGVCGGVPAGAMSAGGHEAFSLGDMSEALAGFGGVSVCADGYAGCIPWVGCVAPSAEDT